MWLSNTRLVDVFKLAFILLGFASTGPNDTASSPILELVTRTTTLFSNSQCRCLCRRRVEKFAVFWCNLSCTNPVFTSQLPKSSASNKVCCWNNCLSINSHLVPLNGFAKSKSGRFDCDLTKVKHFFCIVFCKIEIEAFILVAVLHFIPWYPKRVALVSHVLKLVDVSWHCS